MKQLRSNCWEAIFQLIEKCSGEWQFNILFYILESKEVSYGGYMKSTGDILGEAGKSKAGKPLGLNKK